MDSSMSLSKSMRRMSMSLPKLSMGESKLFKNRLQLQQTTKIFLQRVQSKEQTKTNTQNGQKNNQIRTFIQLPKQGIAQGFTTFKQINKNQSHEILDSIKYLRSRSTLLKPVIKAQILLNKAAHYKISQVNQLRLQQEHLYVAKRVKQLNPASMTKDIKIQQKNMKKIKNVKKITLQLDYKTYQYNLNCYKPYIDFDSLAINIKQEIFFFGGRKLTPPVLYNAIENRWKELPPVQQLKCFGQTQPTLIDNKIYCFGGYDYFQQGFSLMTNSLRVIDFKQSLTERQQFPQNKVGFRAFHSQCVYGRFLIISGGVDKNNKLFSNFMNFNIDKKYWNQLTIQKMPIKLKKGFAKHCTLPIFHPRNNYNIYDNQTIKTIDPLIKQQGIYIFGGQDGDGQLLNTMYILKLGDPSLVIEQLKINGIGPISRRNAKMIRHKQYIIIHGGRNDEMKPSVLNSIHFLNLNNLTWIKIVGQKPPYRHSHSLSMLNDETILILGGKSIEGLSKQIHKMNYTQQIEYI